MSAAWTDSANPNVVIDKKEIVESFKKHAFSSELKEESVGDQVAELIFKKLLEQSGIAGTGQAQQCPELPIDQPKAKDTKKEKYIA
jgi:hypothetical protein